MKDITQVMAEVVQSIRDSYETDFPQFIFGFKKDVASKLAQRDRDRIMKYLKFPLVVLWLNCPDEFHDGIHHYTLNVGIYDRSKMEYDTKQRMEEIIRPKIEPIYNQLIEAFYHYEMFWEGDLTIPPHTKVSAPYGQQKRTDVIKNIYGDPVDAIELTDLKINLLDACEELHPLDFAPSIPPSIQEGSLAIYENGEWTTITLQELANEVNNLPVEEGPVGSTGRPMKQVVDGEWKDVSIGSVVNQILNTPVE